LELLLEGKKKPIRYWRHVVLEPSEPLGVDMNLLSESSLNNLFHEIPKLFADDNDFGFLNIGCELIESMTFSGLNDDEYYIDDIDVIKMVIRNNTKWNILSPFLTAEIFRLAFEVYLSKNWQTLIPACRDVMESINKEILLGTKPGNWQLVQEQCQDIITTLLDHVPINKESERKTFPALLLALSPTREEIKYPFEKLVYYEMNVFTRHNAIYNFMRKFRKSVDIQCYPFNCVVSPAWIWRMSLLSFILFLVCLTYHIYNIDQTPQKSMYLMLADSISEKYNDVLIENFDDYHNWFMDTLIPYLYLNATDHQYFLTDEVLLRVIRVPSEPCQTDFLNQTGSMCYPRLDTTAVEYYDSSLDSPGFTFESQWGKQVLETDDCVYDPSGYAIRLKRNYLDAAPQLNLFDSNSSDWLDWNVQAVIVEFSLYSPDLKLFSLCAIVAEFTNVGKFKPSYDCTIISPEELTLSYSWSAIVLWCFFFGFLLRECWEFYLYMIKQRLVTRSEEMDAELCCTCKSAPSETEVVPNEKSCCPSHVASCATTCYIFCFDLWNFFDMLNICSGLISLFLNLAAYLLLNDFSLYEMWQVAFLLQSARVSMAVCVITAYFRFLYYLVQLRFIGVLVLTLFLTMESVIRFAILFLIITIGFSAAFHLLYNTNPVYTNFVSATLSLPLSIFTDYELPDYSSLVSFPKPAIGYTLQIICLLVCVLVLVNFLIAMMNTVYINITEKSEDKYRWIVIREFKKLKYHAWPVPFNIFQLFFILCCTITRSNVDRDAIVHRSNFGVSVENRKYLTQLYADMVHTYFGEEEEEEDVPNEEGTKPKNSNFIPMDSPRTIIINDE